MHPVKIWRYMDWCSNLPNLKFRMVKDTKKPKICQQPNWRPRNNPILFSKMVLKDIKANRPKDIKPDNLTTLSDMVYRIKRTQRIYQEVEGLNNQNNPRFPFLIGKFHGWIRSKSQLISCQWVVIWIVVL